MCTNREHQSESTTRGMEDEENLQDAPAYSEDKNMWVWIGLTCVFLSVLLAVYILSRQYANTPKQHPPSPGQELSTPHAHEVNMVSAPPQTTNPFKYVLAEASKPENRTVAIVLGGLFAVFIVMLVVLLSLIMARRNQARRMRQELLEKRRLELMKAKPRKQPKQRQEPVPLFCVPDQEKVSPWWGVLVVYQLAMVYLAAYVWLEDGGDNKRLMAVGWLSSVLPVYYLTEWIFQRAQWIGNKLLGVKPRVLAKIVYPFAYITVFVPSSILYLSVKLVSEPFLQVCYLLSIFKRPDTPEIIAALKSSRRLLWASAKKVYTQ